MSYTSNSEFDANRRVQITNEIPPYDYFDGIHSTLTDDMWKWLLGYSRITFDLPDETTVKETGAYYDTDDYFHKMVNGQLSKTYGPKPKKVWNTETNQYDVVRPEYHSIDVYGILLPEEDLFLHEIYRYLECLYPDHPDWSYLLTNNEINDMITNAAHMVNYDPDNLFFEKVAQSLDSKMDDDDIIEESFKIKYRNLTNNAFRRKLYGSRFGYNMFVHDIFQTCSIFPMGTYIPIKPVYKQFIDPNTGKIVTYDELDTSKYVYNQIETNIPEKSLNNRFIDTYDSHYYNKFRLIDWTGESNGYTSLDEEKISIVAYSISDDPTILYEFPASSAPISHTALALNDLLLADNSTEYLTINDIKYDIAHKVYRYVDSKWKHIIDGTNLVGAVQVSFEIEPTFIPMYKTSNKAFDDSEDNRIIENVDINTQPGTNYSFLGYLCDSVDSQGTITKNGIEHNMENIDLIFDPYTQGRIHIRPSQILSYYRDSISFNNTLWPINDDVETPYVIGLEKGTDEDAQNWPPLNIDSENAERYNSLPLKYNDIIANKDLFTVTDPLLGTKSMLSKNIFMMMVSGINAKTGNKSDCGHLYIENTLSAEYNYDEPTSLTKRAIFGVRVTTCKNEQVVFLGQIKNLYCNKVPGYRIQPISSEFFIKAIPEYKDEKMLELCYGKKAEYSERERMNRALLYNDNDTAFTLYEAFTEDATSGMEVLGFMKLIQTNNYKSIEYTNYPELGKGKLTSFDFGCISTIPIYENNSFYTAENSIKTFKITKDCSSIQLVDGLNKSNISLPLSNTSMMYLLEDANILTNYNKVIKEYEEVIISSTIDVEDDSMKDLITFTDDTSRERAKTLSIGDHIYGPSITSTNLYITELLTNQVRVSEPLTKSGVFDLTFSCKMNYTYKDTSTEFDAFRKKLYKNNNLRLNDPFKQTLWPNKGWPNSSLSFIDGYTDTSLYSPFIGWSQGSSPIPYLTEFVIPAIHGNKAIGTKTDKYGTVVYANQLVPCSIKLMGDLFIDLNLNRTYNVPNRQGVTPTLNTVEWLDYMCNNANELTRASDNVNFGTQLLMETDTSGLYSLLSDVQYTDPSTQVRFQTFNWKADTVPVYAQIGIGGENYRKYWKDLNDVTYPSLYGNAIYDGYLNPQTKDELGDPVDNEIKSLEEEYTNEGGKIKTRHVYTDYENRSLFAEDDIVSLDTIDNPIAEIPLGEYDIQMHYRPESDTKALDVMTVQVNVYKQEFSNINEKLEEATKIMSYKLEDPYSNIFVSHSDNTNCFGESTFSESDYHPIKFQCMGEWVPSVTYDKDGSCTIDWPSVTYEKQVEGQNVSFKYSLIEDEVEEKDSLITLYKKGIIPYFIINTGNLYHNVMLTSKNDICGRYPDGEEKGVNIYDAVDPSKKYTVQIENKSILTIEPAYEIVDGKVKLLENKFRWTNKNFKFAGGVGKIRTSENDKDTFDTLSDEGLSTIYTETFNNGNYVKAILKKALASLVKYSKENFSIDRLAGQWTGTAYYSPDFNGITYSGNNGMNASINYDKTVTTRSYLYAFNRFYNQDLVENETQDVPYYTRETSKLRQYYMDFTDNIFFVHALQKDALFEEGDVFCLYPIYTQSNLEFVAVKLDKTLHFVSTLPIERDNILPDEFKLFLNSNCYWQKTIKNYTNEIQLPRSFIADGSYKINLVINPSFEGSVYDYDTYISYLNGTNINEDTGLNEEPSPFTKTITNSTIKYDEDYDVFYITDQILDSGYYDNNEEITETSNTVSVKKYIIKFNENKFFKNAKYVTGKYQLVKTQNPGSSDIVNTPTLTATDLDGMTFDISDITVSDKVLSAALVQLRSNDKASVKPQFFNNYKEMSGQLAEIGEDYLKLSYDTISRKPIVANQDKEDPLFKYAVGLDMINNLSDLLPVSNTYDENGDIDVQTVYDETSTVKFENGILPFDGKEYQSPTITDIKMSHVNEYSGDNVEFKYYKNLLVFEGYVYPNNPNTIYAGTNSYTTSAFSQVQSGDTIVDVVALSSKNKQTVAIKLTKDDNTPLTPDYAIFADGYLLAAKGTELYMAKGSSLASFGSTTALSQVYFAANGNTSTSMYKDFDEIATAKVTAMGVQTSATGKNFIIELSSLPDDLDNPQALNVILRIPMNTLDNSNGAAVSLYTAVDVDSNKNPLYVDDTSKTPVTVFDWKSDVLKVESLSMTVLGRDIIHSTNKISTTDANSKSYTLVNEGTAIATDEPARLSYYAADPKEGYEATVSGDYLFVRSPTALVDSNGSYNGRTSEFMHWKAAVLPKTVDHTRVKLNSLSTEEYENSVNGILQMYYNLTPADKFGDSFNGITWEQCAAATLSSGGSVYNIGNTGKSITKANRDLAISIVAIRSLIVSVFTSSGALAGDGSTASAIKIMSSTTFEEKYSSKAINGTGASANATFTIPGWTVNNEIAELGSNLSYNVKITNNPLARADYNTNVALYEEAYSNTINDFLIYVVGVNGKETLITKAKSVFFSDGKLTVKTVNEDLVSISTSKLTKRDDIEDPDNWVASIYPAKTTFSTSSLANSTDTFQIKVNGTTYSLPTISPDVLNKTFKLTCHYKVGVKEIYGGYTIDKSTLSNAYNATDAYQVANFDTFCSDAGVTHSQHPFLIYTTDGVTYNNVELPSSNIAHLNGKGITSGSSTSTMNGRFVGFLEKDDAVYGVIARSVSTGNAGSFYLSPYLLKISVDNDGEMNLDLGENETNLAWVTRESAKVTDTLTASVSQVKQPKKNNYDPSDTAYEKELAKTYSTTSVEVSSDGLNSNMAGSSTGTEKLSFTPGSDTLSYVTYSALNMKAKNPSVSKCGLQSITFADDLVDGDTESTDAITVLVALQTTADIIDQSQYINPSKYDQYVNAGSENFKVTDVAEVNSYLGANRMYNKREISTVIYDDQKNILSNTEGYPSTDEDIDHKYYVWVESNRLAYTPVTKTGNTYYITQDGVPVPVTPNKDEGESFTTYNGNLCWKHYETVYTPETFTNGAGSDISLCDKDGKFFVRAGDDIPRAVQFASLSKLVANNIPSGYAYSAPKPAYATVTDAQNDPELRVNDELITEALKAIKTTINEFSISENAPYIILKINKDTSKSIKDWVKLQALTDKVDYCEETGKVMTIDSSFNRFVEFRAIVPYTAMNSPAKLNNNYFAFEDGTNILTDASRTAINGVYIPIKGYGGTFDNTNPWTKYTPWELDPIAFKKDASGAFIPMVNSFNEPIYLCDKHGTLLKKENGENIPFMTPKYHSLRELVQYEDYEILETIPEYTAHNNGNDGKYIVNSLYNIKSVSSNAITFTDPITFNVDDTNIDINDGDEHIICLKLITVNPIEIDFLHMNNPDYIVEIPLSATTAYGYDRVYWDDKGYPKSPISINNTIYRSENNDKYNTTDYTCANGALVYECNEDGKYITYTGNGTDLTTHILGASSNGNVAEDPMVKEYGDVRVRPKTPRYASCQDWFKNDYYIKGQEQNPFWQVIQFTSKYDVKTMRYNQIVDLYSYVKSANTMYLAALDKSNQYVLVSKAPSISTTENTIDIVAYDNYINCKKGTIKFILTQNHESDYYKTTSPIFVKYGIVVSNPKYDSGMVTTLVDNNHIKFADDVNDATSYKTITTYLNASYSVNTTENFVDPSDKDAAIISITEMGLFDKNHKLIGYANFPPIEYRTDTQHVDFTTVISYTNLTELTDE